MTFFKSHSPPWVNSPIYGLAVRSDGGDHAEWNRLQWLVQCYNINVLWLLQSTKIKRSYNSIYIFFTSLDTIDHKIYCTWLFWYFLKLGICTINTLANLRSSPDFPKFSHTPVLTAQGILFTLYYSIEKRYTGYASLEVNMYNLECTIANLQISPDFQAHQKKIWMALYLSGCGCGCGCGCRRRRPRRLGTRTNMSETEVE